MNKYLNRFFVLFCFRYPVEKIVHYQVKEYVDRPVPGLWIILGYITICIISKIVHQIHLNHIIHLVHVDKPVAVHVEKKVPVTVYKNVRNLSKKLLCNLLLIHLFLLNSIGPLSSPCTRFEYSICFLFSYLQYFDLPWIIVCFILKLANDSLVLFCRHRRKCFNESNDCSFIHDFTLKLDLKSKSRKKCAIFV